MSFAQTPINTPRDDEQKEEKGMRQLVLQKVSEKEREKFQKDLEAIFFDPNQYFSTTYKGREVVVGKRDIVPKVSEQQKIQGRKSPHRNVRNFGLASSKPKLNMTHSKKVMQVNRRVIDDNELNDIYEKFQAIKTEHNLASLKETENKEEVKLIKGLNKTGKKEMVRIFDLQERALKAYEQERRETDKITEKISRKIKKPSEQLLINKSQRYRLYKEIKDNLCQEVQKRNPKPLYRWVLELRDKDTPHFINFGVKTPHWQLIRSEHQTKETIRNPDTIVNYNITQNTFFSKGSYLQDKISRRTLSTFTQNFSKTMNGFNHMSIKGEDLLQFEMENAKSLKGRKILHVDKMYSLGNEKNIGEEIYTKNVCMRDLFLKRKNLSALPKC